MAKAKPSASALPAPDARYAPVVDEPADDAYAEPTPDADAEAAEPETSDADFLAMLPEGERGKIGAVLFAQACVCYGLNPNPDVRPHEIMPASVAGDRWAYYPGDDYEGTPARIRLVTAGGVKLAFPMDLETEDRLRVIFKAFAVDKVTKVTTPLPLPMNLTLPREAVTGRKPEREPSRFEGTSLQQRARATAGTPRRR